MVELAKISNDGLVLRISRYAIATCLLLLNDVSGLAADWPMWGGNPARTGVTSAELPDNLHLNWILQLRQPDTAWHSNQPRVQFDRAYEPVVASKRMFVGSMVSDRVTAYDTETGKELWRFYTDGPVRLAPAVHQDHVYFVCDDGYLYCLQAADGRVAWKFFGAPFDRKVLGNDRITSIFPARGAPVIYDDTVYFATSIWPFMGVFIHAVDAGSGEVIWTNGGTGSMYLPQQHDRPAFAGISPQGYLAATKDHLLVAGGQTAPAILNRHTGQFSHVNLHSRNMATKGGGSYRIRATDDFFVVNDDLFRMSDSAYLAKVHNPVITEGSIIGIDSSFMMREYDREMTVEKTVDRKGRPAAKANLTELAYGSFYPQLDKVHLMAGQRLYCTGSDGLVAAVEVPGRPGEHDVHWSAVVKGNAQTVIAADDRLFVSTDEGAIYCFSGTEPAGSGPQVISEIVDTNERLNNATEVTDKEIRTLLKETGTRRGYGVLLGLGDGQALDALLTESKLNIVVLEPDPEKVAAHRRRLDDADVYGERVTILPGDLFSVSLPPYLANFVLCEDLDAAGFAKGAAFAEKVFHSLRPYGGAACLKLSAEQHSLFVNWVKEAELPNGLVTRTQDDRYGVLTRVGALPDSDDWTHQYANSGNTVVSADKLVRSPMGILWFGGPSNEKVLPRHGHGPNPQVAGGRLYIEGRNMLRCVDVYTGQLVWEREFLDLGKNYDYTSHEPGAGAIGSNYVSLPDNVYVIQGDTCFRLEAETGETLTTFKTPLIPGSDTRPDWGFLSVHGDVLITGVQPVIFKTHAFNLREMRRHKSDFFDIIRSWKNFEATIPEEDAWAPPAIVENLNRLMFERDMVSKIPPEARTAAGAEKLETQLKEYVAGDAKREIDATAIRMKRQLLEKYYSLPRYRSPRTGTYAAVSHRSSRRLMGFNRLTGAQLWDVPAVFSFRHNTIASGNGKVFALDRLDDALQQHRRRRGEREPRQSRLIAIDAQTGKQLWSSQRRIFGTFLSYSAEHDVVVQAGSAAGDRAMDESSKGMVAYQGEDGKELWENDVSYSGPLMLHHETIYSQPNPGLALKLLTGERINRSHPLSGQDVHWSYCREGGCNTAIGSEHLITFRSSAAGFYELSQDGGTGNWGGFRSSCSSNLIPANGVLNAPDYTRTCSCAFQNRSSLALVHMPEVDVWTFNRFEWDGKRVRQAGLNFGAPGDRRAADGHLWLDYPSVGGSSPDIPVTVEGDNVEYFRQHPSYVGDSDYAWVACSGVYGASSIQVSLTQEAEAAPKKYTVRLHFVELEPDLAAERVFDVRLQGDTVLESFNVLQSAGDVRQPTVKEFTGISAGNELVVELAAESGRTVLSGIELVSEE